MFRIKWVPTFVVMLLTLGVLFGGWSLYRTFGLIHPLQKELQGNPAVMSVAFNFTGKSRTADITFKQVDDLRSAYTGVTDQIKQSIGTDFAVQVESKPSKELTKLYSDLEPIIYEGIAKKNYTEMIGELEKKGSQNGLTLCRISMDRHNLYIQLEKGSDYLYQVVPYQAASDKNTAPADVLEVTS